MLNLINRLHEIVTMVEFLSNMTFSEKRGSLFTLFFQ